jgi:hypothetical protein
MVKRLLLITMTALSLPTYAGLNEVVAPPPDVAVGDNLNTATESSPPSILTSEDINSMFEGYSTTDGSVSGGVISVDIDNSQTKLKGTQVITYTGSVGTTCNVGEQASEAVAIPTLDGLMICQRNLNGGSVWTLQPWE